MAKDDLRKNGHIFTGKLYAANFDGCACILWSETTCMGGGGQIL